MLLDYPDIKKKLGHPPPIIALKDLERNQTTTLVDKE